jgi:hypothetical protein
MFLSLHKPKHKTMSYREQNNELKGKRVRCILMNDKYPVPSGTEGTITSVDDIGTIHVMWDNGSTLGLVPKEDKYELI